MKTIKRLIKELCPNGVKYVNLSKLISKNTFKQITSAHEFESMNKFSGNIKMLPSSKNYDWATDELTAGENIQKGKVISLGRARYANIKYWEGKFISCNNHLITSFDESKILTRYLFHFINNNIKHFYIDTATYPKLEDSIFENFKTPFPPLEIQQKIVEILDKFTLLEAELEAELEARRKQYEYYRDKLLKFPDEGGVMIKDMIDYIQPTKYIVFSTKYNNEYSIPVLTAGKSLYLGYTNETNNIYKASKDKPVIIFDDFTCNFHWVDFEFKIKSSAMKILIPRNVTKYDFKFLFYLMKTLKYDIGRGDHKRHWISKYSEQILNVPNISRQKEIVKVLDSFNILVNDISNGLPKEIELRHKQYEYYRNELLNFKDVVG